MSTKIRPVKRLAAQPVAKKPAPPVPRLWPGCTMVILASGWSLASGHLQPMGVNRWLTPDVEFIRGKARVIAINNGYQLAPWADVLYACDHRWWQWHSGVPAFEGKKFALTTLSGRWPGVTVLKRGGTDGLALNPNSLATGSNGGHQAINLAVHLGATRIILLGYDMQRGPKGQEHWHPDHPQKGRNPYPQWRRLMATLVKPLQDRSIEVLNCTRSTALECFPCARLEDVLTEPMAVAV
jgi:hypothetical protein